MSLATYLHSYLGANLASQLGFSVAGGSYDFVVAESLIRYGATSEELATDKIKLNAIGKVELWSAILREVSMDYDSQSDGVNNRRSQVYEMVKKNLNSCIAELNSLSDFGIQTFDITHNKDPYVFRTV
jgi:hypothetical protein